MVVEIEIKARAGDGEALKRVLMEKAVYMGTFEKEDAYWFTGDDSIFSSASGQSYGLRVRKEKRVLPGGKVTRACVVTRKKKEIKDGVEINDEREFEVNQADAFEEFLGAAGFTPGRFKRKRGWAFSFEGINAELVEAEGLGFFVELEILADNKRAETVALARERLLDFLAGLGIEREAVESRSYGAMLAELYPRG